MAAFLHPMGAELYATSLALAQPMDLQGFHQANLQRLAQQDQALRQQGIQVQRQPLSGLTLGGRPALGVVSQIVFQGQNYVDLAVYTVEGGRAYGLQLTAPAQVFSQVQPLFQQLLAQVQLMGVGGGLSPMPPGMPGYSPPPFGPGLPTPPAYPGPVRANLGLCRRVRVYLPSPRSLAGRPRLLPLPRGGLLLPLLPTGWWSSATARKWEMASSLPWFRVGSITALSPRGPAVGG